MGTSAGWCWPRYGARPWGAPSLKQKRVGRCVGGARGGTARQTWDVHRGVDNADKSHSACGEQGVRRAPPRNADQSERLPLCASSTCTAAAPLFPPGSAPKGSWSRDLPPPTMFSFLGAAPPVTEADENSGSECHAGSILLRNESFHAALGRAGARVAFGVSFGGRKQQKQRLRFFFLRCFRSRSRSRSGSRARARACVCVSCFGERERQGASVCSGSTRIAPLLRCFFCL